MNVVDPQSSLNAELASSPLHPLLTFFNDGYINFCLVPQGGHEFDDMPTTKPYVVVLWDGPKSKGPEAFCQRSLRSLVGCPASTITIINACGPQVATYAAAAVTAASSRRNVLIVETMPEHEAAWETALDEINPDCSTLLCLSLIHI